LTNRRALRLTLPFGRTAGLALVFLVLFAGICEALARSGLLESRLPPRDVGGYYAIGPSLNRLDTVIADEGPVHCFFIGSSATAWGIDPLAFAAAYERRTGEPIHCYNFGLGGMTASGVGIIAEILVNDYQPALIVYGAAARDFAPDYRDPIIETSAWTRYHLGEFSLEGWLIDHSFAYQHYLYVRNWPREYFREDQASRWSAKEHVSSYGFLPLPYSRDVLSRPPDPVDNPMNAEMFETLSGYDPLPSDVAGLERLLALKQRGVEIVVVAMPVPETHYAFYDNGKQDYQKFLDQVERSTRASGVTFWVADGATLIPDDAWADYFHVTGQGARIVSEWLGERVSEAVLQGTLADPAR
jgi:hypothetical protein